MFNEYWLKQFAKLIFQGFSKSPSAFCLFSILSICLCPNRIEVSKGVLLLILIVEDLKYSWEKVKSNFHNENKILYFLKVFCCVNELLLTALKHEEPIWYLLHQWHRGNSYLAFKQQKVWVVHAMSS